MSTPPVSAAVLSGGLASGTTIVAGGGQAFGSAGGPVQGGAFAGGVATGVMISAGMGGLTTVVSGGGRGSSWDDEPPRLPPGETLDQDWPTLAQDVRRGARSLVVRYGWVDALDPQVHWRTVMSRAWSRPASDASWADVRPLIEAGLEQGASLYLTSPGHPTLSELVDPAKLQGWLDLGGDPAAPHTGLPMWWDLVTLGALDLLNTLAASPRWPLWARVRDGAGRSAMARWAEGVYAGARAIATPTLAAALEVFDWLVAHTPAATGSLDEPAVHALLNRALKEYEQPADPDVRAPVPALQLWDVLLRQHLAPGAAARLEPHWASWLDAHRRVKTQEPELYTALHLPIEHRLLRDAAEQAHDRTTLPEHARRRL